MNLKNNNCVVLTDPFYNQYDDFQYTGKIIGFKTTSNTQKIAKMSSFFSKVVWVSLHNKETFHKQKNNRKNSL